MKCVFCRKMKQDNIGDGNIPDIQDWNKPMYDHLVLTRHENNFIHVHGPLRAPQGDLRVLIMLRGLCEQAGWELDYTDILNGQRRIKVKKIREAVNNSSDSNRLLMIGDNT